jgi:hypothetical protein
MGAWGHGPFENDGAADLVAGLMKACRIVADETTTARMARTYYPEARVGVQVRLLAHGTDILGGPPLQVALDALQRIRSDQEWIAGWREPKALKAALDAEIRAVQRAIKKQARRLKRKRTPKPKPKVAQRRHVAMGAEGSTFSEGERRRKVLDKDELAHALLRPKRTVTRRRT